MNVRLTLLYKLWLLLILFSVTNCSASDKQLLSKFHEQMEPVHTMTTGYKLIDLAKLTSFSWDSVYFIRDNSGLDTDALISAKIGFPWSGDIIPNGSTRILFIKGKEVITYFDCSEEAWPGGKHLPIYFYSCYDRQNGITPQQAKLAVFRYGNNGYIHYPIIPIICLESVPAFKQMMVEGCPSLAVQQTRYKEKWAKDSLSQSQEKK